MDDLQAELIAQNATTKIRILGINLAGAEGVPTTSGNDHPEIQGTNLPWLQDTAAANVRGSWGASGRELHILDDFNFRRSIWNHNAQPLNSPGDSNWDALKALLKQIAGEP